MKKYEGVLQRVREIEYKRGITYAKTDGKLYKGLKICYVLSFAWIFITCTMMILGHLIIMSDGTEIDKNFLITSSVCLGAVIIGFVLQLFKQHIAGTAINTVSALFLIFQISSVLKYDLGFLGYRTDFYFYYLIPAVLMIIFAVCMSVIAIRAEIKLNRMYKKVTENLYEMYRISEKDSVNMTDGQWEEFLKNYNPFNKSVIIAEDEETQENEG